MILIDQEIALKDSLWGTVMIQAVKDLLLIPERYLGIRNKDRGNKGMGMAAFKAADALYSESYEG